LVLEHSVLCEVVFVMPTHFPRSTHFQTKFVVLHRDPHLIGHEASQREPSFSIFRRSFQRSSCLCLDFRHSLGLRSEGGCGHIFPGDTYNMRSDTRKRAAFTMTFPCLHIQCLLTLVIISAPRRSICLAHHRWKTRFTSDKVSR
jgi:hypothetical protein